MTTVEDIIRAIQERPEVREQVRRAILTDELLALPQRFAEFTSRFDDLTLIVQSNTEQIAALTSRFDDLTAIVQSNTEQIAILTARLNDLTARVDTLTARVDDLTVSMDALTARVDTLTARVDDLTVRVDALTARVDALTARVDDLTVRLDILTARVDVLTARVDDLTVRMDDLTAVVQKMAEIQAEHTRAIARLEDKVGILIGDRLERRIATILPPRLTQMLGLRRTRITYHPNLMPGSESEFISRVEDAADAGRITDDQEDRIKQTDLIVHSRRKLDGSGVWIAVEASGSIAQRDIARASESAAALRSVFDDDAIAVAIGYRIRDEDRARADSDDVIVLIEDEDAP